MTDWTSDISPPPSPTRSSRKRPSGCLLLLITGLILASLPFGWRKLVQAVYTQQVYTAESVPENRVAIVYGAAVYPGGRLSSVLRDRMDTAVTLYQTDKVNKLIVSGANGSETHNEPDVMRAYAIAQGVDPADIFLDYGGRRTYDTCYRARHIFGLESAILVTQAFHLPRAIFTCNQLGVTTTGVSADLRPYRAARWYEFRETAATLVALYDVVRRQPAAVIGAPTPLP